MRQPRRSWLLGILAALGLKAQTWIPPKRSITNAREWGKTNLPTCPVCGAIGSEPNTPIVVSNADGSLGSTLSRARLFICTGCGCLYAGFTA